MDINELAAYLERMARARRTVFYSQLVERFGLPPLDGNWLGHPLCDAFGILDRQDAEAHRPFRTSMVIAKETNMPGDGYFKSLTLYKGIVVSGEMQRLEAFSRELTATMDHPW